MPIMRRCRRMRCARLRDTMQETRDYGFDAAEGGAMGAGRRRCARCWRRRACGRSRREGFAAPGVVVSYTEDPEIQNGKKFRGAGHADRRRRAAASATSRSGFRTFRLGLFGLDKLYDVEGTLARLTGRGGRGSLTRRGWRGDPRPYVAFGATTEGSARPRTCRAAGAAYCASFPARRASASCAAGRPRRARSSAAARASRSSGRAEHRGAVQRVDARHAGAHL